MNSVHLENNTLLLKGPLTFYTITGVIEQSKTSFCANSIVTVNFQEVTQCDSSSLLLLLSLCRLAKQESRSVKFINLPARLTQLVNLSQLASFFPGGLSSKE